MEKFNLAYRTLCFLTPSIPFQPCFTMSFWSFPLSTMLVSFNFLHQVLFLRQPSYNESMLILAHILRSFSPWSVDHIALRVLWRWYIMVRSPWGGNEAAWQGGKWRERRDQSPTTLFEGIYPKDIDTHSKLSLWKFPLPPNAIKLGTTLLTLCRSSHLHNLIYTSQSITGIMVFFTLFYHMTSSNVSFFRNIFLLDIW